MNNITNNNNTTTTTTTNININTANDKDITVQEIIATFKGIKRKQIYSTAETDNFLTAVKKKAHWTEEEYKEFILAHNIEYMSAEVMDYMAIRSVEKKNQFNLDWNYYFHVIESIEDIEKQKQYVNYYLWYYYSDINEEIYQQLMKKPYFEKVTTESKSRFLEYVLKTDNSNAWVNQYFTDEEFKVGLEKNRLSIDIYDPESANNISKEKEDSIKNFYNDYEHLMSEDVKLRMLYNIVGRGSINLINFMYNEKNIKNIKKLHLFWNICSDTSAGNPLEILTLFKDLGLKFIPNDLIRSKKHSQWGYMQNTDQLEHFFKSLKAEKEYKKINNKLGYKTKVAEKQKVSKI